MKKIVPYLFLFALIIPQLSWISRCIGKVKSDQEISLLKKEIEEEDSERSEKEGKSESDSEKETESKKLFFNLLIAKGIILIDGELSKSFSHYINHYHYLFSSITITPPELFFLSV